MASNSPVVRSPPPPATAPPPCPPRARLRDEARVSPGHFPSPEIWRAWAGQGGDAVVAVAVALGGGRGGGIIRAPFAVSCSMRFLLAISLRRNTYLKGFVCVLRWPSTGGLVLAVPVESEMQQRLAPCPSRASHLCAPSREVGDKSSVAPPAN